MKLSDFDYQLPKNLIAQAPTSSRDHCRLMVLNRKSKTISHHFFYELADLLAQNTLLVFNNSKVIKARLYGLINNKKIEILLLKKFPGAQIWQVFARPAKKLKKGCKIDFLPRKDRQNKSKNLQYHENPPNQQKAANQLTAEVIEELPDGTRTIKFPNNKKNFNDILEEYGIMPLPPYITQFHGNEQEYQTIYAKTSGSIAAPTAGLHFTKNLLQKITKKGIEKAELTLHVGRGTFQEVRTDNIADHQMHEEYFSVSRKCLNQVIKGKKAGTKICAVGTTSARCLETLARKNLICAPTSSQIKDREKPEIASWTDIFIYPGYQFHCVDALITNFHLPKSTLLMLVSAFAGQDFINKAYQEAIKIGYRFYSFGDAMLIL